MPTANLLSRLSQDFSNLYENSHNHDVVIVAGEEPDTRDFNVHSLVLGARSAYFLSALSGNWEVKQKNGMILFQKPNITPQVFEVILRYIYTGVVDFDQQNTNTVLSCLAAADELILEELTEFIQDYLTEQKTEWLQDNVIYVLSTLIGRETCSKLRNYCLERICDNPRPILDAKNFELLDRNILIMLIQRDDLAADELKIWQRLVQWGIHQSSTTFDSNIKNWELEDFEELEKILCDFIAHIRFFQMTRDEFHQHVYPFRKILPKTLKHELIGYFVASNFQPTWTVLPPRNLSFNSGIITYRHASHIENWINRQEFRPTTIPHIRYRWNLLYRASRDGFGADNFHAKCDNQGGCVVVVKILGQDVVVGGYNPTGWIPNIGSFSCSENSFIYFFDLSLSLNAKVSRVLPNKIHQAIYQSSTHGPLFGAAELYICSHCNENRGSKCITHNMYENKIVLGDFYVEDYEVFKIIM